MVSKRVVFPAPFGPMMAMNSPCCTVRVMLWITGVVSPS